MILTKYDKMCYIYTVGRGKVVKKMKNKGFTLIELLAVIVILAIIALIATPIILGIINQSRIGAAEASATAIIKSVGDAYGQAVLAAKEICQH